jgi:hypothetical protein
VAARPWGFESLRPHRRPKFSALQALEREELVARSGGHAEINEPFLAQWIAREQGG